MDDDRQLSPSTGGGNPFEAPAITPAATGTTRRRNRIAVIRPLRNRDFALLWTGLSVSMIGDGIFYVAIAWLVYDLVNLPTALSTVMFAFSVAHVMFLLLGGVMSDRFDRRRLMILSDLIRGASIGGIAALAISGSIELWHIYVLIAVYGLGEAFFGPAFGAIVPDVVPTNELVEANSLNHLIRPFALRLVGPALGGWLVEAVGGGAALAVDAATFGVSAVAVAFMRPRPLTPSIEKRSALREIREGFAFTRSQVWLWGTLVSAAIGVFAFIGPFEVLMPYLVKNRLNGNAADLGAVFVAGGAGAIVTSFVLGQRGLPRRHMTLMYVAWAIGFGLIAVFGVATEMWQVLAASALAWAAFTAGTIVWATLMHTLVPRALLGRVTSVDWLVSFGFAPLSFAITGPVAEAVGPEETLFIASAVGFLVTIAFLYLPGMRDTERTGALTQPTAAETEEAVA